MVRPGIISAQDQEIGGLKTFVTGIKTNSMRPYNNGADIGSLVLPYKDIFASSSFVVAEKAINQQAWVRSIQLQIEGS
jgi:hypothetical protein